MVRKWTVVFLIFNLFCCVAAKGQQDNDLWQRDSITNGFFGLNSELEDNGVELGFSLTQIYQQNLQGGLSTHRRQGRHTGSYDLELAVDFEKLLGIKGGRLYMLTEGSWSRRDIDQTSVGSIFGVNGDFKGRRSMDVTELWYEQAALDGALLVRFGKMDLTGGFLHHNCPVAFDCSMYANDENTQFLNNALINNPTIPFPDFGLGIAVHYSQPESIWYVSGAAADAQADIRETGFNTAFHDEDYFFYILETGVTPQFSSEQGSLQGVYRAGVWFDCQEKTQFSNNKNRHDDRGLYLSCGQMVYKENNNPDDTQGLGLFGRYGYADSNLNEITNFWSVGFQYEGLIEGRNADVLGFGFAQGFLSNSKGSNGGVGYSDDYESVCELYYNTKVTPWLEISPSLQYVVNPGGAGTAGDALILGARAFMVF